MRPFEPQWTLAGVTSDCFLDLNLFIERVLIRISNIITVRCLKVKQLELIHIERLGPNSKPEPTSTCRIRMASAYSDDMSFRSTYFPVAGSIRDTDERSTSRRRLQRDNEARSVSKYNYHYR